MHRNDPGRIKLLDQLRRRTAVDRRHPTDRDKEKVDLADRLHLLSAQLRLAEVAHMAHANPVSLEHVDHVCSPLGAGDGVMFGRNPDHASNWGIESPRRGADGLLHTADHLDRVVVPVLVCDQKEIGGSVSDRRVAPGHPSRASRLHVAEGVDED